MLLSLNRAEFTAGVPCQGCCRLVLGSIATMEGGRYVTVLVCLFARLRLYVTFNQEKNDDRHIENRKAQSKEITHAHIVEVAARIPSHVGQCLLRPQKGLLMPHKWLPLHRQNMRYCS